MKQRSLTVQSFIRYFVISLITMIVFLGAMTKVTTQYIMENHKKQLYGIGILYQELLRGTQGLVTEDLDAKLSSLAIETGTRLTLIDKDGVVRIDSEKDPATMDNHYSRPEVKTAFLGDLGISSRYSKTLDQKMLYLALPKLEPSDPWIIRLSIPISFIQEHYYILFKKILVSIILASIFGLLFAFMYARKQAILFKELAKVSDAFAKGQFEQKFPITKESEISSFIRSMEKMSELLKNRIETVSKQKQERGALLSSMQEAVISIDVTGKIIMMNRAAHKMLISDQSVAEGRHYKEVIRNLAMCQLIERIYDENRAVSEEVSYSLGSKNSVLYVNGSPIYMDEKALSAVVIVCHDITRLKKLETIRQEFVANVSHELKTPITIIKSCIETIHQELEDDGEKTVLKFLAMLEKHSNRLHVIIDDLLLLSKLESDPTLKEAFTTVDLLETINAAIAISDFQALEHKVAVKLHEEPGKYFVEGQESLMIQAIKNLLENAIKVSPKDSEVDISLTEKESTINLTIEDRGCGIHKKHLPKLFERFYRVDPARSRDLGGTGLGLSIVKHIMKVHKGSVLVESEVNKGTKFSLLFPIQR